MKVKEPLHGIKHYKYPCSRELISLKHSSIVIAHNGGHKADITGAHCPHEHGISQLIIKSIMAPTVLVTVVGL